MQIVLHPPPLIRLRLWVSPFWLRLWLLLQIYKIPKRYDFLIKFSSLRMCLYCTVLYKYIICGSLKYVKILSKLNQIHTKQILLAYQQVEPEPVEPKLFEVWSRSRNYLFDKYCIYCSQCGGCYCRTKKNLFICVFTAVSVEDATVGWRKTYLYVYLLQSVWRMLYCRMKKNLFICVFTAVSVEDAIL